MTDFFQVRVATIHNNGSVTTTNQLFGPDDGRKTVVIVDDNDRILHSVNIGKWFKDNDRSWLTSSMVVDQYRKNNEPPEDPDRYRC